MGFKRGRNALCVIVPLLFVVANWRMENSCNQTPLGQSARPRLLVNIASYYTLEKARQVAYLVQVLNAFRGAEYAALVDVTIRIDTNSDQLRDALLDQLAPFVDEIRVWTEGDMRRIFPGGRALTPTSNIFEKLTWVHRFAMQENRDKFDFFHFSDDDVLLPASTFKRYMDQREELQQHGWSYGFTLCERGGATDRGDWAEGDPISISGIGPNYELPIYVTHEGHMYAAPTNPYTNFYIIDQTELRAFMSDASHIWENGFHTFGVRESFAVGFGFKFHGGNTYPVGWVDAIGWYSSALIPLTPAGKVHPDSIVWHLPLKYSNATWYPRPDRVFHIAKLFHWQKDLEQYKVDVSRNVFHQEQ